MTISFFRNKLNASKKKLIKKVKRGMLAKRILVLVQMVKFTGKCKEIFEYIKSKRRYRESAMFVAMAVLIRTRRKIKNNGKDFHTRLR